MPTGTIAPPHRQRFRFHRDEGGIEHFFHRSAVRGAVFELLREGQRVEFSSEESTRTTRRRCSIDRELGFLPLAAAFQKNGGAELLPLRPGPRGVVGAMPPSCRPIGYSQCGPFADGSSSKLTRCPSLSCSKLPAFTELR